MLFLFPKVFYDLALPKCEIFKTFLLTLPWSEDSTTHLINSESKRNNYEKANTKGL